MLKVITNDWGNVVFFESRQKPADFFFKASVYLKQIRILWVYTYEEFALVCVVHSKTQKEEYVAKQNQIKIGP